MQTTCTQDVSELTDALPMLVPPRSRVSLRTLATDWTGFQKQHLEREVWAEFAIPISTTLLCSFPGLPRSWLTVKASKVHAFFSFVAC